MVERCGVSMEKLYSKGKYEPVELDKNVPMVWGFKPKGSGAGVVDAIKDAMGL
jgi:hypothetical protein